MVRAYAAFGVLTAVSTGFAIHARVARADGATDLQVVSFADRWPQVPADDHFLSLEDRVTDHLTDYGNELGDHMQDRLHVDLIGLRFDGRARRARRARRRRQRALPDARRRWRHPLHVDGMARITAKRRSRDRGPAKSAPQLPDFEMVPESYNGDRYVPKSSVPLLELPPGDERARRQLPGRSWPGDATTAVGSAPFFEKRAASRDRSARKKPAPRTATAPSTRSSRR